MQLTVSSSKMVTSLAAKLWDLLGRKAEAAGAQPWFGVSNRQLRKSKYLASFESNQLFRIPKAPRDYVPFDLPQRPLGAAVYCNIQHSVISYSNRWVPYCSHPPSKAHSSACEVAFGPYRSRRDQTA